MIRITFLLRRKPELSREQFQQYWRETHGPVVASHATRLRALRYVQVHTLDDVLNAALPGARGPMEPPYDGVAELWWEDLETVREVLGSDGGRAAGAELLEDEGRFIDLPNSPLWLGYEYPQINPSPENIVARERSPIVKLYFPLRARSELKEADAQLYWRTNHGPIIRRHAAGTILRYVQVHRAETELEAALREARGTVTEPYTGHAELWFDSRQMGAATPDRQRAAEVAVEDESKFIDFARSSLWLGKEHVFIDRM
jgi:uncharacterized protein (TIGR02118 family)